MFFPKGLALFNQSSSIGNAQSLTGFVACVRRGRRELLLESPGDNGNSLRLRNTFLSRERLLAAVSPEAGVAQSTDAAGFFLPLAPPSLLFTVATCGTHSVYPSSKEIRVKKQKQNLLLFCEGDTCCSCTLLQTSVCDFEGPIT